MIKLRNLSKGSETPWGYQPTDGKLLLCRLFSFYTPVMAYSGGKIDGIHAWLDFKLDRNPIPYSLKIVSLRDIIGL
jgi:hypothetical protein